MQLQAPVAADGVSYAGMNAPQHSQRGRTCFAARRCAASTAQVATGSSFSLFCIRLPFTVEIHESKTTENGTRELDAIMIEVERDVRSGDHAFAKHDEDDSPNGLEREKNFRAPDGFDARRQLSDDGTIPW